MYAYPTFVLLLLLFLAVALLIEFGYRFGQRYDANLGEAKNHISTIQGSMLAILGLLLGFSFNLALQRYDARCASVVKEANAIGTAYLRTDLLNEPLRAKAKEQMQRYLERRVETGTLPETRDAERATLIAQGKAAMRQLWQDATAETRAQPNPATNGLFVQALNETIDSFGESEALLHRHVPGLVLGLLALTLLMASLMLGFTAGLASHRATLATYVLVMMIAVLVFIIMDLDRPRRGLIQVPQEPLSSLLESWREPPPAQ